MTVGWPRAALLVPFVACAIDVAAQGHGNRKNAEPADPERHAFGTSYYLLASPPPGKKKEPRGLIVMLHGSGGRPENCVPCYAEAVAKGYFVCLPASVDPASYDATDEQQVLAMVEDVLAHHLIDRDRVLLSGHSAGAALSFFLVSKRPDLFTACAAGAAGLRFPADALRAAAHVPFYVATGAKDFNLKECTATKEKLEAVGVEVTLRNEPEWDHGLAPAAWSAMFAWFDALVPAEQGKALQNARQGVFAKTWSKAGPVLAKLMAGKDTTAHAKVRAGLLLDEIDRAADAELAAIHELIDDHRLPDAIARLGKAKTAFADTRAATRFDADLRDCQRQLQPPK